MSVKRVNNLTVNVWEGGYPVWIELSHDDNPHATIRLSHRGVTRPCVSGEGGSKRGT